MYLTESAVVAAIKELKANVHPFLGITFLACKSFDLPIGYQTQVSVDSLNKKHLEKFHRTDPKSSYYFQPFRSNQQWVSAKKYASSGLQTVNTQTFNQVFLHARNSKSWGFEEEYIAKIKDTLTEISYPNRVSALALAIWIFKGRSIRANDGISGLIDRFFREFGISPKEQSELFHLDTRIDGVTEGNAFSEEPFVASRLLGHFEPPPDAKTEQGKSLGSLTIYQSSIAEKLTINFGERLSLVAGDNGLGKSFLLEFAWWAATGTWAGRPILPDVMDRSRTPRVEYTISVSASNSVSAAMEFDYSQYEWKRSRTRRRTNKTPTVQALCIFSRADGSFAVFDPIKNQIAGSSTNQVMTLSSNEVWNGKEGVIEGLIRDWIRWESSEDKTTFDRFKAVLRRLSPEDLGELRPGKSIRIYPDPRDIPTIEHEYGTVPVIYASSGVQRVLLLSYLIILAWQEHELAADHLSQSSLRRLIVFIDELEAHLHPKWQRIVLPALMGVGDLLSGEMTMQTIAATHSPMILASIEPAYDSEQDALFHLFTEKGAVKLEELPFVKYGDASGWLTSPLFGLRHARSREAERAIERAKVLQLEEKPDSQEVVKLTNELRRVLSNEDSFWPRWLFFAEKHGAKL